MISIGQEKIAEVKVLELKFEFAPIKFYYHGRNVTISKNWSLKIRSSTFKKSNANQKVLPNPIGQTGVKIVVLIYADKKGYNISVNGGDHILYPHKYNASIINRVEASYLRFLFLVLPSLIITDRILF
uniref:Galectin n=1 Tax=Meloidogyne hapla TaxID=6305 RepID=A0A1I8B7U3_MELHA